MVSEPTAITGTSPTGIRVTVSQVMSRKAAEEIAARMLANGWTDPVLTPRVSVAEFLAGTKAA